jgi:phage-related protein
MGRSSISRWRLAKLLVDRKIVLELSEAREWLADKGRLRSGLWRAPAEARKLRVE